MKSLSLYEPWATLIAIGAKNFETRSWSTSYRGPLLICASVKHPPWKDVLDILSRACLTPNNLSPGRAVCLVDLAAILKTDNFTFAPYDHEPHFGDFSPGRFAWKLENVRRFKNPPPIKGRQGLFEVDDELIKSLDTHPPI